MLGYKVIVTNQQIVLGQSRGRGLRVEPAMTGGRHKKKLCPGLWPGHWGVLLFLLCGYSFSIFSGGMPVISVISAEG
jgi:hypothetical protein